jgi:transposase-like protein
VIDQLLAGAKSEEEIVGPGGLMSALTKRVVERALKVELTDHLGYEQHREPLVGVDEYQERVDTEDALDRLALNAAAGADLGFTLWLTL